MTYQNKPLRDKNIAEQVISIKSQHKNFNVKFTASTLKLVGYMQPTSRSEKYLVEIKYKLKEFPKVYVLEPQLEKNFNQENIPHIYPGEKLCLFQPKYKEFKFSDLISNTIIPWTSLWLYYYEVWHMTGLWLGGGEYPVTK